MTKIQIDLTAEELYALHQVAERTGTSVDKLIRAAIRRMWIRPARQGPVALWDGELRRSSAEHDSLYDET
ncbi:MAG TPA: hypothetical protein VGE98_08365 [Thermoanaerobaculia bacterium]